MMRSYSSRVSPCATARSAVTFGADPTTSAAPAAARRSAAEDGSVLDQATQDGVEEQEPVGAAADAGLGRPLGMRHQADHGALLVADAGDVPEGAVGVGGRGDLAGLGAVPEDDLAALPHPLQRVAVHVVAPLSVRDRHLE